MARVEIEVEASQDRDIRTLSVIIVVRKTISRNIVSSGKKENKGGGHKHDRNDDEKFERVATTTCEDLMVICDENLVNLVCDETSWVIDIGASIHVISRRDFVTSYTLSDFEVLKMGNNDLVPVTGMRDVSLVSNMLVYAQRPIIR
ncbi:hypothetical protein V6N11_081264 [Hibiscus sabdariffa]|uniref:Retrovirus-related Pol polyprotein from transposon TNT 1-94-like beta-barrel domain-containing protein n=1 Tax=Hibiscus sabdariffa TaxID=183260 RepID=A0ABR2QJC8_9ROSI